MGYRSIRLYHCLVFSMAFLPIASFAFAQTIAFPEAEGFGRFAKGGRAGQVIEVTNLKDSGIGSFREALTASGPRIIVFRVGGTINLNDKITISNPYVTIAGQTTPGDGILIRGGKLQIQTHDVIIRHIRVRPGINQPNPGSADAIQIIGTGSHDIIIDHVSASWGVDEVLSVSSSAGPNITIQWSIISESLHCANHPEGCHGKGILVGHGATGVSILHNLLAHHSDRNPQLTSGKIDFVNNLIYNYGNQQGGQMYAREAPLLVNYIGNYYLPGPSTKSSLVDKGPVRLRDRQSNGTLYKYTNDSRLYFQGNIQPIARPNNTFPEEAIIRIEDGNGIPTVKQQHGFHSLTITDAWKAKEDVLAKAGATFPKRDAVDIRVINSVINKSGKVINSESEVGGFPTLNSAASPTDSDHDGMPDQWETARGLNYQDGSDGSKDSDGNGFTNLEEYLNSLVSDDGAVDNLPPAPPSNLNIVSSN